MRRLLFFSVVPLALPADRRVEPAGLVTGPGAQATAVHRAVEREEHVVLIFTQLAAIPLTATNLQQEESPYRLILTLKSTLTLNASRRFCKCLNATTRGYKFFA